MKPPRVQSLLAALVLLTCSSWSTGANTGKKKSPSSAPTLPTWQAQEEPSSDWLKVHLTDPATKKSSVLRCRRSDCAAGKTAGMAPLYRITETKKETVLVDEKVPRYVTVLGRTFPMGTKTEKHRMDKVFYSSELSNYQYDLAAKEVSQGSFRQKTDIYDPLAKHDQPSFEAMRTMMVVSAPHKVANDVVASKPQGKPRRQPGSKPGSKPETKPEVTPEPKPEVKPEPKPEVKPETKPEAVLDTKELDKDELDSLSDEDRGIYEKSLKAAKDEKDPVKIGMLNAKYRKIAAQNLRELDKDEFENLTRAQQVSYDQSLKQAKGKNDRKEIAAVIAKYRKQAEMNKLTDVKDMKDFDALAPAQKDLFCDKLKRTSSGGAAGSHDGKAIDQAKTAAKGTTHADGTFSGAASNLVATVPPAPPSKLPEGELKKLAEACDKFLSGKPAADGSQAAAKEPPTPATKGDDCEKKDKDGKCVEEKKADPNAWLAVKTGVVGMLPGVMVGSFFGPVGIVVGAAVGFALFWGLAKLNS